MLPGSLVEPVENACRRQQILLARLYRMAENGAAIEEASDRRREVGPHRELACPGLVVEKARQRKGMSVTALNARGSRQRRPSQFGNASMDRITLARHKEFAQCRSMSGLPIRPPP
jgi:hypothetical protein